MNKTIHTPITICRRCEAPGRARRLWLWLLVACALTAAAKRPLLNNYSPRDYDAGPQNWSIAFTGDRCILLGNTQGMLLFDSQTWHKHRLPNYSSVYSLMYEPGSHRVWAGGSSEMGYFAYDRRSHALAFHSILGTLRDSDHIGEVWRIVDWSGKVVFQTRSHIYLHERGGRTAAIATDGAADCMAVVDDRLLVATASGLYYCDGNHLKRAPGTDVLDGMTIKGLLAAPGGGTLIATESHGLFTYDGIATRPLTLDITPFLLANHVFCATQQGSVVALGTIHGGAVIKDLATGTTSYANRATGLRNNTVLTARFDDVGNLWLGLDQGVAYVMQGANYSNLLSDTYPIGTGYTSIVDGNRLYLGTNQGVYYVPYPVPDGAEPVQPVPVPGLSGQAWTLTRIDGTLLCGNDHGAHVLRGGRATRIDRAEGTWKFLPLRQHPGLVLCCDYRSLFLLDRATLTWLGRVEGFDITGGQFYEDADDGTIWLCHWQQGVFHLWLSDDARRVVRQEAYGSGRGLPVTEGNVLCQVGDTIYISSPDGFHRYDRRSGALVEAKWLTRVFNTYDNALNLYETPRGELWAYKGHYLAFARRTAGGWVADTLTYKPLCDLLQMSLGRFSALDSTHTLLNAGSGFVVATGDTTRTAAQPRVLVSSITSFGARDTVVWNIEPDARQQELAVPHSRNSLTVDFVMPDYVRPGDIAYQVLLEGYDHGWGAPQTTTTKTYTQLPSGTYKLHIRAVNRVTGHSDHTTMQLTVLRAWYETWWALIIWTALAAALVAGAMALLKRRERRQLMALEQENARQRQQMEDDNRRQMQEKERQLREQQTQLELEQHRRENEVNRLRAEQLELELKHRSSELADSAMNLARKNDILVRLDQQLTQLSDDVWHGKSQMAITQSIKDIRSDIQFNIQDDAHWEKFQENFNMVYDNFMARITERFPDLKTNDKKLIAYLRMGLSSKEMASLLNTSVRSIETARYRLRKKLGLEQGENMSDFIQHF